ncbi:LysE family transporter [Cellulomonas sp. JZ18]|uniref:LysE family transporter n=1 Tax=Cellulomonas sp. JZ18 TaxID=2654191 RepID=UPI001E290A45|nr:LysE family transporter [Cellulomonas sp. JZ18]
MLAPVDGLGAAVGSGVLAGFGIAVPVGAVGALIVLLGARHGWRTGCAAGLGAAVVDGVYATVAVVAGAALAPVLVRAAEPVRWVSAAVLLVVALLLLRTSARTADVDPRDDAATTRPGRAFLLVLAATVVNPTTVVYFVALTTGAATTTLTTGTQRTAFVLGALVASAAWQLLLGTAGAWAGRALTGERGRRWTARVGALVVLALAVRTALGA